MFIHKRLLLSASVLFFLLPINQTNACNDFFFKKDSAVVKEEQQTGEYITGESYFGRNKYIEYVPGNLPIVVSAPHGGYEKPDEIKDRTYGSTNRDKKTLEIILEFQKAVHRLTGGYAYLIINHLHRIKLDPNRELEIAAQEDSLASIAYKEFHEFIDIAEKDVASKFGKGIYFDLHAHPHENQRIELGYLLESELLGLTDEDLNNELFIEKSSITNLVKSSPYTFIELLRGDVSFGALLVKYGYPATPSPSDPAPLTTDFYAGGYNTATHGGTSDDNFIGIQLELPWDGIRDSDDNINKFSENLVKIISEYLKLHHEYEIITGDK